MNTLYRTHAAQKLERAYAKLQTKQLRVDLLAQFERIQERLSGDRNLSDKRKRSLENAQLEINELLFLNDMRHIQEEFYPVSVNHIHLDIERTEDSEHAVISVTKLFDAINNPLDLETRVTRFGYIMSYSDILTNILQENAAYILRENIEKIDLYELLG